MLTDGAVWAIYIPTDFLPTFSSIPERRVSVSHEGGGLRHFFCTSVSSTLSVLNVVKDCPVVFGNWPLYNYALPFFPQDSSPISVPFTNSSILFWLLVASFSIFLLPIHRNHCILSRVFLLLLLWFDCLLSWAFTSVCGMHMYFHVCLGLCDSVSIYVSVCISVCVYLWRSEVKVSSLISLYFFFLRQGL